MKNLDKEIANVKNPFQATLVVLSHPKLLIPLIIIVVIIFSFATIRVINVNGKYIFEKKELKVGKTLDKTLEKVNKIKNVITEEGK